MPSIFIMNHIVSIRYFIRFGFIVVHLLMLEHLVIIDFMHTFFILPYKISINFSMQKLINLYHLYEIYFENPHQKLSFFTQNDIQWRMKKIVIVVI